jgi:hypothetical protein
MARAPMIWLRVRDGDPVELPGPAGGLESVPGGTFISVSSEERAEELLGTGLVTRFDTSFIAIRVSPGLELEGIDLSNNRVVAIRENIPHRDADPEFPGQVFYIEFDTAMALVTAGKAEPLWPEDL